MRADYVMVGGFLGAGKTTALLRLAEHFTAQGRRVGLITNDQSHGLVDTSMVAAKGYPVEEITGGCFCCRFTSLTDASEKLTRDARPEVFLAEPVGSCTDLRATVQYPLRRLYGDDYRVAPLSVLVDPKRAARVLDLEQGRGFSPKVQYVYEKQLEEADLIVINKIDAVDAARLEQLRNHVAALVPNAPVLAISARQRIGLDEWFSRLFHTELDARPSPDVDYDVYADGEARLGWFNATVHATSGVPFDGNALLHDVAEAVQRRLAEQHVEIAHFKMTLTADQMADDMAAINVTRSDAPPELSHRLRDQLTGGQLLLNLRAEAAPDTLQHAVQDALAACGTAADGPRLRVVHAEAFSPARPNPTHRMATA